MFNFLMTHPTVSLSGCTILHSPAERRGSSFSTSLPTVIFCFFVCLFCLDNRRFHGCEVVPRCGFGPHFPHDSSVLSIFSCAYWPFVYLLWRNVCSSPKPFFNCVVFLMLHCEDSSYIPDTNLDPYQICDL